MIPIWVSEAIIASGILGQIGKRRGRLLVEHYYVFFGILVVAALVIWLLLKRKEDKPGWKP